jgi:DNA-binding response OmpR family regulator
MAKSPSRSTFLGRVLLIDDEPETVDLLQAILLDAGFDVVCALNGGDGLMLENLERPDVVLLDLTMPGVSGFEVLRRMRSTRADVPVIIVSGQSDLNLARATLECGAANYIRKPFDPDHLIDAVTAALASRAAPSRHNTDAWPRRPPPNLPRGGHS